MPKLTKKAIRLGSTDGRADPNYRKALLLKRKLGSILSYIYDKQVDKQKKCVD